MASWGGSKSRIITVQFSSSGLTSDGLGHLLSLPHNTLSKLSELDLGYNKLDSKSCEMLAHCMSSLPHSKRLELVHNQIGCEGTQLLSQSLHTTTTLKELGLSKNGIQDKGVLQSG